MAKEYRIDLSNPARDDDDILPIDRYNKRGHALIHIAMRYGKRNLLEYALANYADPFRRDRAHFAPEDFLAVFSGKVPKGGAGSGFFKKRDREFILMKEMLKDAQTCRAMHSLRRRTREATLALS